MPTITITVSPGAAQRIQDALTPRLDQPATLADVETLLKDSLRALVRAHETEEAVQTAEQSVTPLTI